MLKNNGFTLIEVLVATSIIFMLVATIMPIIPLLEQERTVLSERRIISAKLHDELQVHLWNDLKLPTEFSAVVDLVNVTFRFAYVESYIEGCVEWRNARNKNETVCLYGYK